MGRKVFMFAMLVLALGLAVFAANAQEAVGEAAAGMTMAKAVGLLAVGLTIAIAAFAGALGQGRAVAAGLEGIARNPGAAMLVPMLLGLAFIESLVIYALVIAFMLFGKVG
jgi:F-type H+-transporting ATPase subunit c